MKRREFLTTTVAASTLLAAGRLPLLAAPSPAPVGAAAGLPDVVGGSGIDAGIGPYPVKMIRRDLASRRPVAADTSLAASWKTLRYEIIHYFFGANLSHRGLPMCRPVGTLQIDRARTADEVRYQVKSVSVSANWERRQRATILTDGSPLRQLREWSLVSSINPAGGVRPALAASPKSQLHEKGRCDGQEVTWGAVDSPRVRRASVPVVNGWTLLDYFSGRPAKVPVGPVDLLEDLTTWRLRQELRFDDQFDIPMAGGMTVPLDGYLMIGPGTLPTHYLVDDRGLVQLVTAGIISWALVEIS